MKQISERLTYANVMSTIAVFLVLGGATALAATELGKNTVGTKQLKSNAVTTAKIKKEAVASAKIKSAAVTSSKLGVAAVGTNNVAEGAITSAKLGDAAATTAKIADSAVTAGKLATGERSEGFHVESSGTSAQLANPIAEPPTTVLTTTLPAGGHYFVMAQTALINSIGATRFTECTLSDDGVELAEMASQYEPALIFPSGGVSMSGFSDGGTLKVSCKSNGNNTFAFKTQINAIRVGSVG